MSDGRRPVRMKYCDLRRPSLPVFGIGICHWEGTDEENGAVAVSACFKKLWLYFLLREYPVLDPCSQVTNLAATFLQLHLNTSGVGPKFAHITVVTALAAILNY